MSMALAAAGISACDSKRKAPEAGAAASASDLAAKAAEPEPADVPRPEPVYAPEQWKSYRRHMGQGRRLGDQGRWGEAARAFEAALESIPTDGRALSELGWAALQAGDYERARSANLDAVQAASDPAVRAASLYNLGRLAEATGDREEAARQYRASLALRASEVVDKRLAALSTPAPPAMSSGTQYQRCGPSASVDVLCACIRVHKGQGGRAPGCTREERQVPGAELLFVGDEIREDVHLIAHEPGNQGWSAVAMLGTVYRPEAGGTHEELEVARFERRLMGERKILWIETVQTRTTTEAAEPKPGSAPDPGQGPEQVTPRETHRVRTLTVCSWPDTGRLACPLQVPLVETVERSASGPSQSQSLAAGERTVRRLAVDIRDDGMASVVLEEGPRTDAVAGLLGQRKLW